MLGGRGFGHGFRSGFNVIYLVTLLIRVSSASCVSLPRSCCIDGEVTRLLRSTFHVALQLRRNLQALLVDSSIESTVWLYCQLVRFSIKSHHEIIKAPCVSQDTLFCFRRRKLDKANGCFPAITRLPCLSSKLTSPGDTRTSPAPEKPRTGTAWLSSILTPMRSPSDCGISVPSTTLRQIAYFRCFQRFRKRLFAVAKNK